jgi:hypothetical protein
VSRALIELLFIVGTLGLFQRRVSKIIIDGEHS